MKTNYSKMFCLGLLLVFQQLGSQALRAGTVATIDINNLDSGAPIFYLSSGKLLPVSGSYVQLLAGPTPESMAPVQTASADKSSVFSLAMDGYFYAGVGVVPGVAAGNQAYFQVRAWKNTTSFDTATERAVSTVFTQVTGSWTDNSIPPAPATGPALKLPATPAMIVQNAPLPPSITQQPASQIVTVNAAVTLAVTASGSGTLTYQWYRDGTILSGQTRSTLTFNPVQLAHAGRYTVTVANSAGSATSQAAILIVNPAPVALSGKIATVTLNNLDVSHPLTYLNSTTLLPMAGSFVQLLGGPSQDSLAPVFSLTPDQSSILPLAMDGYFYGGTGGVPGVVPGALAYFQLRIWRDATSFETALERGVSAIFSQITGSWDANAVPPAPATGPMLQVPAVNVVRYTGYSLDLAVNLYQGGTINRSAQPGADGTYPAGTTLTLTAQPAAGYSFSRWSGQVPAGQETLNPLSGFKMDRNKSVTANFVAALSITTQPVSQTVDAGTQVSFTVVANAAGAPSYQWRFNGAPLTDNSQVQGSKTATLMLSAVQSANAGSYDVKVTYGVNSVTSSAATLTIRVPATLVLQRSSVGQALLHLQGTPGLTYVVESSPDLGSWSPVGTNTTSTSGGADWIVPLAKSPSVGQFFRARVQDGNFVADPFNLATINLNNYDKNVPIYYQGQWATGNVRVQLLGGPVGGPLHPVYSIDVNPAAVFALSEPGYFYGGTGLVEGINGGQEGQFQLRAWFDADSYETATRRGASALFQQVTGKYNSKASPPQVPIGLPLEIPANLVIQ